MGTVRVKFTKGNEIKYISHLDLMRTFMRVVRRAEIPISYSGGFNPHPEMSFGAPLSLGVASLSEYVDIELEEEMAAEEVVRRLNESMPMGIKVLGAALLPANAKSAMSLVTHAAYTITVLTENRECAGLREKLQDFISQKSIMARKAQPKKNFKIKEIDIRPMIAEMKLVHCDENNSSFSCLLHSGSRANLKPELLMEALEEYMEVRFKRISITREDVFSEQDGKLEDLLQYKE
jgi:radical SAM-linked protein